MSRSKRTRIALVVSLLLMVTAATSATLPTWCFNDHSVGAVTFYTTVPGDQVTAGPSLVQVTAITDTVRISWHYYNGSSWVALKGNVAYGDTNLAIGPGETAVFTFPYPKPDLGFLSGNGTARIWGE